jgi:hypothetical protein
MGGTYVGKKRNVCRMLVGRPEDRRSLGKPRCRREDNIIKYFKEIVWEAMD